MNYINGFWQQEIAETFESRNPATGEIVWQGHSAPFREVDKAIKAARQALPSWRRLSVADRLVYLENFVHHLEEEKATIAKLISAETGKPLWECLQEVASSIAKLGHSRNSFTARCADKKVAAGEAQSVTRFRSIGVMGILGPFNFPLHLPNGQIIPALLAGNTIVFKPSELTPAVGEKMVKLWESTGLPSGVLNLVQGGPETGEEIINHKWANAVLFTGSYRTARHIHYSLAGDMEKLLVLEAGGNNPLIADGSGDLEKVCLLIAQSAFLTAGQRCVCARRLIVPQGALGDQLITELIAFCRRISWGVPNDIAEPFMGTLISEAAADKVELAYKELLVEGAQILLPLQRDDDIRSLVSPALVDVTNITARADVEIFGPLLQVIRVADMKAAFTEAEATRFGLSAGILTEDRSVYEDYLSVSSAGIINWNRQITGALGSAPFGGTGCSGNFRPGASLAADFCSYPIASVECDQLTKIDQLPAGISERSE
jgi:succinylglutamic semialdehyde dehydrogenase